MRIFASLLTPSTPQATSSNNTVAKPIPHGFYLIIGRGLAAWYNHATLLKSDWGRKRLTHKIYSDKDPERLSVMHLGLKDPWSRRGEERMGQWPRMLNYFAGFDANDANYRTKAKKLGLADEVLADRNWLRSSDFSTSLTELEEYVCDHYKMIWRNNEVVGAGEAEFEGAPGHGPRIEINDGFVGVIEEHGTFASKPVPKAEGDRRTAAKMLADPVIWENPTCKYRVSVFFKPPGATKAEGYFIYAYKIDVCAGLGMPRTFDPAILTDHALFTSHVPKYDELPSTTIDWSRPWLLNGNDYIGMANDSAKSVVIMKGNAVGAQAVQSALTMPDLGAPVRLAWWVHSAWMYTYPAVDSWVPGCRNNLEIAGTIAEGRFLYENDRQVAELRDHFNLRNNPAFRAFRENRPALFAPRLVNLEYHEIIEVKASGGKVECTLALKGSRTKPPPSDELRAQYAKGSIANIPEGIRLGTELTITSDVVTTLKADGLVFAQGQEFSKTVEGTASYILQQLAKDWKEAFDAATGFIMGIMNGVADEAAGDGTGCIRVLGATALVSAPTLLADGHGYSGTSTNPGSHFNHIKTLPRESTAKDGGGINPALTSIRRANRYKDPRLKINTAGLAELMAAGLSKDAAEWIIARRSATDRGFEIADYVRQFRAKTKGGFFGSAHLIDAPLTRAVEALTPEQLNFAPESDLRGTLSQEVVDWILDRRAGSEMLLTSEQIVRELRSTVAVPYFKGNGTVDAGKLVGGAFTF